MLVALVSIFFILGFGTAILGSTHPEIARANVEYFFSNIRVFLDVLRGESISPAGKFVGKEKVTVLEQRNKTLLTRAELEEKYEVGSWQQVAFEELQTTLLARRRDSKKFPCVYATKGLRANDHRYVFLESDDPAQPRNIRLLGPAIRSYLAEAHHLGPNTSLVIICAPSDNLKTVEEYNNRFWNFLRGLRIYDSEEWPSDVPQQTTDSHWTFCFNGEPVFPIALTPAHDKRRSRYASNLLIAMQPKWVIDNLMSTPEKRRSATSTVRALLKDYDDIEISPDLSNYGDEGKSESRQLTLLDENSPSECPYVDFDA